MPRSVLKRRSLLVDFRKFRLSLDRELGASVRPQARAWHLPGEHLQFGLALDVFRQLEGGRRGARLAAHQHFAFLHLKRGQPHAFRRQQGGNLVEQFDRVNVRVNRPLNVPPTVRRLLNGPNRRRLRRKRALQFLHLRPLPPDVTRQRGEQAEVDDQRARQQTPYTVAPPFSQVKRFNLRRQQPRMLLG